MSELLLIDDHIFNPVTSRNPVEGIERTTDGGWTTVDTIQNPKQIKSARKLDTGKIDVVAYKGDGMEEARALRLMADTDQPVMITLGTGESWGQWTIKTVTTKYTKIKERGISQVLKISISIEEYRQNAHSSTR